MFTKQFNPPLHSVNNALVRHIGQCRVKRIANAVYEYIFMFLEISSIHGLYHLTARNRSTAERVLWLCFIFLAVIGATQLSLHTWNRYQENPTVISMERDFREWNTSFPSITICPQNKYDNRTTLDLAEMLSRGESTDVMVKFLKDLTNATYENFEGLGDGVQDDIIPPEQYMKYIFQNTYKFTYQMDSNNPITKTATEMGLCYTVLSNVANYNSPENWWRNNWTTVKSETQLYGNVLNGEVSAQVLNINSGAKIYIHGANEMPDSSRHWELLNYNHYLSLSVVALSIYSTAEVRLLSISQRKCRYFDESNLDVSSVYSYNFCRMQCRVEHSMRLCNCIPHFYRTKVKYPVCNFKGLKCLGTNKDILINLRTSKHNICNCLPPCIDVNYVIDTSRQIEWKLGTNLKLTMNKYPKMRLKRDILFGFTDLLVAIGATTGLFLGCSILSFLEIFYFFSLRLFWYLNTRKLH